MVDRSFFSLRYSAMVFISLDLHLADEFATAWIRMIYSVWNQAHPLIQIPLGVSGTNRTPRKPSLLRPLGSMTLSGCSPRPAKFLGG